MDKSIFIKDLREKSPVAGTFLVTKKESGVSKNGKEYLIMRIMDRTGELEARIWDNAQELAKNFERNEVVYLRGFVVSYQGKLQVNVNDITSIGEGDYRIGDFLPASERDSDEMLAELDGIISGVNDVHIKALLCSIFAPGEVRELFKIAPAAKAMHHPYIGGLIEHVLSICGLVDRVSGHYGPDVDRDMLIAGGILHDIGKIYELSYRTSFDYTDEGRLIGHITIGVELVEDNIRKVEGFPRHKAMLLKHMLLSHHGKYEFGSPKRPKTLEAIILSFIDDLDAKVNAARAAFDAEAASPDGWTSYQRIFERFLYMRGGEGEEEGDGQEAAAPEPPMANPLPASSSEKAAPGGGTAASAGKAEDFVGAGDGEEKKKNSLDLFS